MKKIFPVLLLVFGFASSASAANTVNGCYHKVNGQLRILTSSSKKCLSSETAVTLATASSPATGNYANPLVYDANNQFLGVGQAGDIYIPSLRMWTTLNLRDLSGDIWSGQLYFQSVDCTGQAYAEYENLHRVFGIGQPGERQYYTAAAEHEGYLHFNSLADGSGACSGDISQYDQMLDMSKAVPVDLPFTVPVALPTKLVNP